MSKFKFELNKEGVGELLKSEEMQDVLEGYARQVAKTAGPEYKAVQMSTRVIVVPETREAEQDNYENNTLLRSL